MAVRVPDADSRSRSSAAGPSRIVEVSDDEIAEAIRDPLQRHPYRAPRAPAPRALAALIKEGDRLQGRRVA